MDAITTELPWHEKIKMSTEFEGLKKIGAGQRVTTVPWFLWVCVLGCVSPPELLSRCFRKNHYDLWGNPHRNRKPQCFTSSWNQGSVHLQLHCWDFSHKQWGIFTNHVMCHLLREQGQKPFSTEAEYRQEGQKPPSEQHQGSNQQIGCTSFSQTETVLS